jgi:hypothetical protein
MHVKRHPKSDTIHPQGNPYRLAQLWGKALVFFQNKSKV